MIVVVLKTRLNKIGFTVIFVQSEVSVAVLHKQINPSVSLHTLKSAVLS
jgi:hypothetical protein